MADFNLLQKTHGEYMPGATKQKGKKEKQKKKGKKEKATKKKEGEGEEFAGFDKEKEGGAESGGEGEFGFGGEEGGAAASAPSQEAAAEIKRLQAELAKKDAELAKKDAEKDAELAKKDAEKDAAVAAEAAEKDAARARLQAHLSTLKAARKPGAASSAAAAATAAVYVDPATAAILANVELRSAEFVGNLVGFQKNKLGMVQVFKTSATPGLLEAFDLPVTPTGIIDPATGEYRLELFQRQCDGVTPVQSVDDAYEAAEQAQPGFAQLLDDVVARFQTGKEGKKGKKGKKGKGTGSGGDVGVVAVHAPGLKERPRAIKKAADDYSARPAPRLLVVRVDRMADYGDDGASSQETAATQEMESDGEETEPQPEPLDYWGALLSTTGKEPMIKFTGDVVTLGRKPDSTLRLRGTHFSGKHCSIYRGSD
eukprot:gene19896-34848_t